MNTQQSFILPKLSVMMFLQFFIWGAWFLTVPSYMGKIETLGISPYWAYAAHPIAAMISPFFVGLIADRYFNTEKILAGLFLLAGLFMIALPMIAEADGKLVTIGSGEDAKQALEIQFFGMTVLQHKAFSLFTFLHLLFYMPTLALTASLSFSHLPGGSKQFPIVRLWGTMGWIIAGLVLAFCFKKLVMVDGVEKNMSSASAGQFYISAGACAVLGFFSFFLPKTPAPKKGEKANLSDLLFLNVWKEFKVPSFAIFVLVSFLLCIPLQAYYAYVQTQMEGQNILPISIWKNVGTWLEAGMMFMMPWFFRKLGIKKMIAFGIAAWVVRYILFSFAAGAGVVPTDLGFVPMHTAFFLMIAGIALHGFCYDFFFVSGQIYVDEVTDPRIRAQAQAMIVFFTQGLGMYIGALVNEKLFIRAFQAKDVGEAFGKAGKPENLHMWNDFWWPLAGVAAVVLVIFLVAFKHKDKPEDSEKLSH